MSVTIGGDGARTFLLQTLNRRTSLRKFLVAVKEEDKIEEEAYLPSDLGLRLTYIISIAQILSRVKCR